MAKQFLEKSFKIPLSIFYFSNLIPINRCSACYIRPKRRYIALHLFSHSRKTLLDEGVLLHYQGRQRILEGEIWLRGCTRPLFILGPIRISQRPPGSTESGTSWRLRGRTLRVASDRKYSTDICSLFSLYVIYDLKSRLKGTPDCFVYKIDISMFCVSIK